MGAWCENRFSARPSLLLFLCLLTACFPVCLQSHQRPCNDTLYQVEVDGKTIEEYVELEKKIASAEAFR